MTPAGGHRRRRVPGNALWSQSAVRQASLASLVGEIPTPEGLASHWESSLERLYGDINI